MGSMRWVLKSLTERVPKPTLQPLETLVCHGRHVQYLLYARSEAAADASFFVGNTAKLRFHAFELSHFATLNVTHSSLLSGRTV